MALDHRLRQIINLVEGIFSNGVNIIPRSSRDEIIEQKPGYLKIKLKAAPVKGQANKSLIKFLAKKYNISPSRIEIIKGLTSKNKLVRIY